MVQKEKEGGQQLPWPTCTPRNAAIHCLLMSKYPFWPPLSTVVLSAHGCLFHRILEKQAAPSLTAFVWNLHHTALESVKSALRQSPYHRTSIITVPCPSPATCPLHVGFSESWPQRPGILILSTDTPRKNLGWWVVPVLPSSQAHVLHHPAFQLLRESQWKGRGLLSACPEQRLGLN